MKSAFAFWIQGFLFFTKRHIQFFLSFSLNVTFILFFLEFQFLKRTNFFSSAHIAILQYVYKILLLLCKVWRCNQMKMVPTSLKETVKWAKLYQFDDRFVSKKLIQDRQSLFKRIKRLWYLMLIGNSLALKPVSRN